MPVFLKAAFPSFIWNVPTERKVLFLTFDDGPIPGVTSSVLGLLRAFKAKATFFCIGENIQKHPHIYSQIVIDGHSTGNHTYNHLNGWKTKTKAYLDNIELCDFFLKPQTKNSKPSTPNPLFRPPYGKLLPSQVSRLKSKYSIVLWDVLSKDWKENLTGDQCFERVKRRAKPGSIVLFHDSLKAEKRMLPALEKTLEYFSAQGYLFESL